MAPQFHSSPCPLVSIHCPYNLPRPNKEHRNNSGSNNNKTQQQVKQSRENISSLSNVHYNVSLVWFLWHHQYWASPGYHVVILCHGDPAVLVQWDQPFHVFQWLTDDFRVSQLKPWTWTWTRMAAELVSLPAPRFPYRVSSSALLWLSHPMQALAGGRVSSPPAHLHPCLQSQLHSDAQSRQKAYLSKDKPLPPLPLFSPPFHPLLCFSSLFSSPILSGSSFLLNFLWSMSWIMGESPRDQEC